MRCGHYERHLIEAAAGSPQSPGLEAHLRECPACRQRLARDRQLLEDFDRRLGASLLVEPSADFTGRVATRLQASRGTKLAWGYWAPALAAGLGALVVAGWLVRRTPPPVRVSAHDIQVADAPAAAMHALPPGPAAPPPRPVAPHVVRERSLPSPAKISPPAPPEVLVPPAAEAALQRFVADLQRGALPVPSLLAAATAPGSAVGAPEPIGIMPPIEIAPLETNPLLDRADSPTRSDS